MLLAILESRDSNSRLSFDIDQVDEKGRTALHKAAMAGYLHLCKLLVKVKFLSTIQVMAGNSVFESVRLPATDTVPSLPRLQLPLLLLLLLLLRLSPSLSRSISRSLPLSVPSLPTSV